MRKLVKACVMALPLLYMYPNMTNIPNLMVHDVYLSPFWNTLTDVYE